MLEVITSRNDTKSKQYFNTSKKQEFMEGRKARSVCVCVGGGVQSNLYSITKHKYLTAESDRTKK